MTASRADHDAHSETSSMRFNASPMHGASVSACDNMANSDVHVSANSESCSQRSRRHANGSNSKYSMMLPFVLRFSTPTIHWQTENEKTNAE